MGRRAVAESDTMTDCAADDHDDRRYRDRPRLPAAQAPGPGAVVRRVGGHRARLLPGGGGRADARRRCCSRSTRSASFAAAGACRAKGSRSGSTSTTGRTRRRACSRSRSRRCSAPRSPAAATRRPELADAAMPLELHVPALPVPRRGRPGAAAVRAARLAGRRPPRRRSTRRFPDWGESRYLDVRLAGTVRLADALNHLYVLLPVLDDAKHYWVSTDEVDKLVRAGGDWLAGAPGEGADHPPLPGAQAGAHGGRARAAGRGRRHRRRKSSTTRSRARRTVAEPDRPARSPSSAAARCSPRSAAPARPRSATSAAARACWSATCSPTTSIEQVVAIDVSARALQIAARRLGWTG